MVGSREKTTKKSLYLLCCCFEQKKFSHSTDLFTGTATFEELNDLLRSLDSKISLLKISVVQSLNSTFVLYETDLERVVQWFTEIREIQDHLVDLEAQLGKDVRISLLDTFLKISNSG